ncbi:MAG TPA: sn-glycerol-3-phosphate ABC transporter ATP-binding protein UgpC [Gaiellaceae bacterium]|jgi:multiple sugar transport system ATP-binding protein|nr:sn-glycerol-3-phosphate ABC transporter ATP-binding protein UgpC [Gaiellaceae bacterium]
MASVRFEGIGKVYPDGTRAVLDLNLEVEDGEFAVFVGPSGCGKTTALRMVAGLEEISEGNLRIGDEVVNLLDPRKRDVAMIFQNYALYPHMTIYDNIAFPLQSRGVPKQEIKERVTRTAELLGLGEVLRRRPKTLSGGQRQRVAMGRALVREPQVFLMDEPLSNLDAKLRVQMRAEIADIQHNLGATTIYVTHDQVEAMTMGDRIAVMRKGVLQQYGPPQELYDRPVNLFVATFIGSPAMNLFKARIEEEGESLACVLGDQRIAIPPAVASSFAGLGAYKGRDLALGIRPEHLTDAPQTGQTASAVLHGEVRLVEALGFERHVHIDVHAEPVLSSEVLEVAADTDVASLQSLRQVAATGRVQAVGRFNAASAVAPGDPVDAVIAVDHLHFFDLETGLALR